MFALKFTVLFSYRVVLFYRLIRNKLRVCMCEHTRVNICVIDVEGAEEEEETG